METKALQTLFNGPRLALTIRLSLLLLITLGISRTNAQTANTYIYTTSTGQSLDGMSGSSNLIGNQSDDGPSSNPSIGFNFDFEGTTYTNYSVTPDGFLKLGSTTSSQPSNSFASTNNLPKLCPWWDDLHTGGGSSSGHVSTVLKGSSPNRIRVVEWFVTIPKNTLSNAVPNAKFQIWLYENGDAIEFRYGSSSNNGTSASVGIKGASTSTSRYISITTSSHASSNSSTNDANSTWPGNGRMYRFVPPPPACSGTPAPGNTLTSDTQICPGSDIDLSIQNIIPGTGVTYQWQSGPSSSGPWTNFGTNVNSINTILSATTWYRCAVTCSGNTGNSTPVLVTAANCCNYTFRLRDDDGDGWEGALMQIRIGTTVVYTLGSTFTNGSVLDIPVPLMSGTVYNLFYLNDGSDANEVGIRVYDYNGTQIHSTGYGNGNQGSTLFTFTANCPTPCSGTPAPGNTLANLTYACSTESFDLSLQNTFSTAGITYQWQSSPNNSTWTNISGATAETHTRTQSTATWYRCNVTCNAGGTGSSTSVFVNQTLCYCTSGATNDNDDEIFNVTLNTLNNTSNCSTEGPGAGSEVGTYSNYTTLTPTNLTQGVTYPVSLKLAYCNGDNYNTSAAVFIDFNHNGTFDASERAYNTPYQQYSVNGTVVTGSIVVPNCAVTGISRMRVVMTENSSSPSACGTYTYGETEDYLVNIVAGTIVNPVATSISGPSSGTCASNLTFNAAAGYVGTIQWQSSTTLGGPYTDIAGGSAASQVVSAPSPGTYYLRARFTGQGCVSDVYSNEKTVVINAPVVSVTSSHPTNSICRGVSVTLTANGTGPYAWSNGATTQSINVSPLFTATYNVSAGSGSCSGAGVSTVTVIGGPVASASFLPTGTHCPGTAISLNGNLTTNAPAQTTVSGGSISINTLLPAQGNPYPSNMTVSGLTGAATILNVKINGFSHSFPSDVDVALVAPNGSKVLLLADDGSGNDINNSNLTFLDGAPALPGTLSTGTYRTTTNTSWSGNTISGPFSTTLSSLNGSFNGTWKLYVFDDKFFDGGSINSWSITFSTPAPPFNYDGPVTYTWSGTNGFSSNSPVIIDTPDANTVYTLTVADNSCSSTSTVSAAVYTSPIVSTFTGSPFCENSSVDFSTDGAGAITGGVTGSLAVTISGPGFLDEISWKVRNAANAIIGQGGNYANGSSNTITVNPVASDYPVKFEVETQGTFGDNELDYEVVCSLGSAVLVSGHLDGGLTFVSNPQNCGSPLGGLIYSWTGPNGFNSNQEDPNISNAQSNQSGDYTVTITDGHGCTAAATTNVTVNDNPEPFLVSVNPMSCDNANDGSFQVFVNGGTPFFSYFDFNLGQSFTGAYFGIPAGTYYIEVSDLNQCMSLAPLEVIVPEVPNVAPVITCPADISTTNDVGVCGSLISYITPLGVDACPVIGTLQTSGFASGDVFPVGTTINTFEVTDDHGLTAACTFSVTVVDNLQPVFSVQASNTVVECDGAGNTSDLNNWLANHGNAVASDECGAVVWSDNYNGLTVQCGSTSNATVTFTATDAHGNAASTIASFSIVDTTPPAITASANQTVECDGSGNTAALNAWLAANGGATSSDDCSVISWSNDFAPLTPLCGASASRTVTFTATDACGNASSTTATFTIEDTTAPVITAASSQTEECDGSGNTAALTAWIASNGGATASDACSGISWSNNFTSLSNLCGQTGSRTVTFTATDACGNAATSVATFTIVDTTPPAITAASSQTIECAGSGNGAARIAWLNSHGGATASDACSGVTWSNNYSGLSNLCGATGSATVTFTATDACGNASTSTATFTIVDTTAPAITSASSQTVECDGSGNAAARVAWLANHGGATASDGCSGISWSSNYSGMSNMCGSTGNATVIFTATDACGNAASSTATFTIVDTTPPAVSAAADLTVECDGAGNIAAKNAWLANHGGANASDDCSGVTWSDDYNGLSSSCGSTGSTTVAFTATDACGNATSRTATFTIVDTTPPAITAAASETVECDGAGNTAALTAWLANHGGANASDDCSGVNWNNDYNALTSLCGSTGTATVLFTASDDCGNASTTSATFTIVDTTPPALVVPANIVVSNDFNQCGATVNFSASASDMCSGSASIAYSIAPGTFYSIGTTTVDVTATDACGNTTLESFTVKVEDTQLPEITCASDIVGVNDPGVCGAAKTFVVLFADNCTGASMIQIAGLPSGSVFPVGTTVNTFVASDASGNSKTCSFSVSIADIENPTILNCPADFSACNPISWTPPSISDNCPGVQVTSSHAPGSIFPIGTTTVTYTATDAYNNSSTCSFNVTRLENSVAATNITSNRDYNNICSGDNITLTINGGSLGYLANWRWYTGSCGGTLLPAFNGLTSITVNPTVTTTYYARAEGFCNNSICRSVTVVVSTSSPAAVTITSAPAFGAPGVTGVITCTPVIGATFYRWTSNLGHINAVWFNGGPGPVETTTNSVNVAFQLALQNYQIRVVAGNACGRSSNASAHIRGTVPATTCLNGPVLACPNTVRTYSVAACQISGTNNYQWSVTGGNASIISGQGTTTIAVLFAPGFTNATICVNGVSNFGLAGPQTCLNVSNSTSAPAAISGNDEPCQMSQETYSILPVTGAISYVWTTNISGATISGTSTTGTVTFPSGSFSGQVCVQTVSGCGTSVASCYNVVSGVPGIPGPISGPASGICGASNVNYALSTNDANSYSWILPAGVNLVSGGTSNSVNVSFANGLIGPQTITVEAYYNCGTSSSSIVVTGTPSAPSITPATICPGEEQLYFASAIGSGLTFDWITTGEDYAYCTNPSCSQFNIGWSTSGGTMAVTATNSCGTSPAFTLSTNCRIAANGEMETKVYPNPTSGYLTVEFNSYAGGTYNMVITDMSGRTVVSEDVKASSGLNQHIVDLSNANPGLYMLYMNDGQGKISVTKVTVE